MTSRAVLKVMANTKVGGAITSRWPNAFAASGSVYAGLASPTASANSRIFSRPTSYGSVGG